ncbi:MAG: response regulator transcription factor [Actinomycetota bacterium]|nr:response regulator transcription factor [Actinomycetota bacterium]
MLDSVTYALRREGFDVGAETDGEAGLDAALAGDYDLVVLDSMLPKLPGTEVCRRLRATSAIPILMLTAKASEVDRVVGLELGADDYVTKPFSMAELVSRIRAILRRRMLDRPSDHALYRAGGLELDAVRHEVRVDGSAVRLTPSEFRLLHLLVSEPERVFLRREIMERLWKSEHLGDQRACDVHVSNLRRKIERNPERPERIVTVRGVGYKLARV